MELKRILNIVLSVLGIILMLFFNREAVSDIIRYELQWSDILKLAITEFNFTAFIVLILIFVDFTKRQILSMIGLLLFMGDLVYKAFVYIPYFLKENIGYGDDEIYFTFKAILYTELIISFILIALLIQYVFVKKKSNAFMKLNIFLAPILYVALSIRWTIGTSAVDFLEKLKEMILQGYMVEMCLIWCILALVLYLRMVESAFVKGH